MKLHLLASGSKKTSPKNSRKCCLMKCKNWAWQFIKRQLLSHPSNNGLKIKMKSRFNRQVISFCRSRKVNQTKRNHCQALDSTPSPPSLSLNQANLINQRQDSKKTLQKCFRARSKHLPSLPMRTCLDMRRIKVQGSSSNKKIRRLSWVAVVQKKLAPPTTLSTKRASST